jgi:nicotinate phosphoribosyltransferase
MAFESEEEAFETYGRVLPNNCVFLVDTYDTLDGVRNAIREGRRLREQGHEVVGIRLDSGDLAFLSIEARRMLDEAGFPDASIVASNELDEHIITSLKEQGARIGVWGVGTKLATAYDQPALGGVYKLAAVRDPDGPWEYRIKLSEQAIKIPIPGLLQVRRFQRYEHFAGDMIFDQAAPMKRDRLIVDRADFTRRKTVPADAAFEDVLVPIMEAGEVVYRSPELPAVRERAAAQRAMLHASIRRFVHPHEYPVGLELGTHERMTALVAEARHGSAR